jgi:creatinine amidohydrolase
MRYRDFVRTGWKVSEIAIGGDWGQVDDRESIDTLFYAYEKAVNFVDTAGLYGKGHSDALYYATRGGHSRYPWTVMMESKRTIPQLLPKTLTRLEDFGVRVAALFSGHFADRQLAMIDDIAREWNAPARALKVMATAANRIEGIAFAPDHAGIFETTLLGGLWPDRVEIDKLPAPAASPDKDDRHDPRHPLWGVFGPDPRQYDAGQGPALVSAAAAWLIRKVRRELDGFGDVELRSHKEEAKARV